MGETNVVVQGDPQVTAQTSKGKEGSTSTQTPTTYTKEQVQKFVSDALAEQGRKHKAELEPIITERDTLKSKLTELSDIQDDRTDLQRRIDELANDDPAKFNLVKKENELRERERKLNKDIGEREKKLTESESKHAERIKKADSVEREASILEIVEGYENGDADRLGDAITTFETTFGIKVTSDEQIRKVADTLWTKKATGPPKPEVPPLKPFSGTTDGGSEDTSNLSPREKIELGIEKLKKK